MATPILRRLYRARALATFVLCLPGVLLALWYSWGAYANLDRYRRAAAPERPLTMEAWHIALHDLLRTDVRRMTMAPPPERSELEHYRLNLNREQWNKLLDSASQKEREYSEGRIEHNGTAIDARVRLRGGRHWHTLGPQKSMKIKLAKGELLGGHRVFNLINDPTSMVVGEELILDLARERGVLTPRSHFARVEVNTKDLGVFHYETGADESLLRAEQRVPGSLFNGELDKGIPTPSLWSSSKHWTKIGSRLSTEEERASFKDLDHFLSKVGTANGLEFQDFATHELSLQAFANMDMLDVAFGGDQHDYRDNHKYYFDPYRGRWEPIAWNFRGFKADPLFNLVENPVLLRLKYTPGYLALRDRLLYEFLTTEGRPAAIAERAGKLLTQLAPELRTDPYWDAYRQLPRVDLFHRQMLRPNTLRRLALVVESELTTYRDRHHQLMTELERNPLFLHVGPTKSEASPRTASASADEDGIESAAAEQAPQAPRFSTELKLIVNGRAGARLKEIALDFDSSCADVSVALFKGPTQLPTVFASNTLELLAPLDLHPAIRLVRHEAANERRGAVRSEIAPVTYPLTLRSSCAPRLVSAEARHIATRARVRSQEASPDLLASVPASRLGPKDVPTLTVGEVAPHPWQLPTPSKEKLVLGPGEVKVDSTQVFPAHQSVTIRAGTQFKMGPGASLIFLGRVRFKGTRDAPIRIEPSTDQAWGGLALQGPSTAGSRLKHVVARGGRVPQWRQVPFPGMLNVHDTQNIEIDECHFGSNDGKGDLLHLTYVTALRISDTEVVNVGGDAVDLEYAEGRLERVRMINVGDDGVDLMGSRVEVIDSVVVGAEGNGISAGERTTVELRNSLVSKAKVGVQAKNASTANLYGSVLFKNKTGVRTYKKTSRYAGESVVNANALYVVASKKAAVKRKDQEGSKLDRGNAKLDLPQPGALEHVLRDLLHLENWESLAAWVKKTRKEAVL